MISGLTGRKDCAAEALRLCHQTPLPASREKIGGPGAEIVIEQRLIIN